MGESSDTRKAEMFEQLKKVLQSIERGPQTSSPKIQRVDNHLRENPNFGKYYLPRLLSIGPIHHGVENLKLGEQYKLLWTAMYLKENKQDRDVLCQRIEEIIEELKGLYTEDAIRGYNNNTLVCMLFIDGCSVLQIMQKFDLLHPEELGIKPDQLKHVIRDLHLLENQIPYKILQILSKDETTLMPSMLNLAFGSSARNIIFYDLVSKFGGRESFIKHLIEKHFFQDPQGKTKPYHLLDFFRLMFLESQHSMQNNGKEETKITVPEHKEKDLNLGWQTYKNIRELKAAGIQVKRKITASLNDVSFVSKWFSGVLKIPAFYVDESSLHLSLNLIAYERCPDFRNNFEVNSYIASYIAFFDDGNDVKELRLAGVFQSFPGSDEELATLMNNIRSELACTGLYLSSNGKMPYDENYTKVKYQIEKHCSNKWKTWLAQAYNTYFSNPWSICAFLATILALTLTVIQTWMAVHPNN